MSEETKCNCKSQMAKLDESFDDLKLATMRLHGACHRALGRSQLALFALVCVTTWLLIEQFVL